MSTGGGQLRVPGGGQLRVRVYLKRVQVPPETPANFSVGVPKMSTVSKGMPCRGHRQHLGLVEELGVIRRWVPIRRGYRKSSAIYVFWAGGEQ